MDDTKQSRQETGERSVPEVYESSRSKLRILPRRLYHLLYVRFRQLWWAVFFLVLVFCGYLLYPYLPFLSHHITFVDLDFFSSLQVQSGTQQLLNEDGIDIKAYRVPERVASSSDFRFDLAVSIEEETPAFPRAKARDEEDAPQDSSIEPPDTAPRQIMVRVSTLPETFQITPQEINFPASPRSLEVKIPRSQNLPASFIIELELLENGKPLEDLSIPPIEIGVVTLSDYFWPLLFFLLASALLGYRNLEPLVLKLAGQQPSGTSNAA